LFVLVALLLLSCSTSNQKERLQFSEKGRSVPEFNADSALGFIDDQLAFGPRYPGSTGHEQAKAYLREKLENLAGEQNVFTQHFTHIGYEKDTLQLGNIIAAFNTRAADRIMLCAHWDTRPRADKDPEHPEQPILGADDGASGVAVLLELARLFKSNNPPIGVDIILFDGEDYGKEGDNRQYFLGSRYWARNQPVKNYRPRFGILLDMVGGEGAKFPKEAYSYRVAPALVDEIWEKKPILTGWRRHWSMRSGRLVDKLDSRSCSWMKSVRIFQMTM